MAKLNTTARLMLGSAALALSFCPSAKAASTPPISKGEKVQVNFVCRLDSGELAAATYKDSVFDENARRSSIYLALKNDAPAEIIAGGDPQSDKEDGHFDFADAITTRLSETTVGMRSGDGKTIAIAAAELPSRPGRTIELARVRRRPKEMRMTAEEYQQRTGKTPEVGQELTFDPAVPGKVVSAQGEEVVVRFTAPVGDYVETPFGRALIKEDEHSYLLEIEAQKGALVRSGALVGRIVQVTDRSFAIDYGHPLGGENLQCDIVVERKSAAAVKEQNS